jgi:hypothetical protein
LIETPGIEVIFPGTLESISKLDSDMLQSKCTPDCFQGHDDSRAAHRGRLHIRCVCAPYEKKYLETGLETKPCLEIRDSGVKSYILISLD